MFFKAHLKLLYCVCMVINGLVDVLCVFVVPLIGVGVEGEESWVPGPLSSLSGLLPLSLFQHKLLLRGSHLVFIANRSGHMLPQPAGKHTEPPLLLSHSSLMC